MKHVHLGAITFSVGILLSACGGGGGGGSRGLVNPDPPSTPSADMQTAFSGTATRDIAAAAPAARNLLNAGGQSGDPIFGSVVQALTAGISGVTGG